MDDATAAQEGIGISGRSVLESLPWIFFLLLLPFLVIALWIQFFLLNTDRFVETTRTVIDDERVQDSTAALLTERIQEQRPELRTELGTRALMLVIGEVIGADFFHQVWDNALNSVHRQLLDGEDEIVLRLDDAFPEVSNRLQERFPELAQLTQRIENSDRARTGIVIAKEEDYPGIWQGVRWTKIGCIVTFIVAAALIAVGIFVASNRIRAIIIWGLATALVCIVLALFAELITPVATFRVSPTARQGAEAAVGIVIDEVQRVAMIAKVTRERAAKAAEQSRTALA